MKSIKLFQNSRDMRTFAAGETIFKEGDKGEVMFAIVEGTVDIKFHEDIIDKLEQGDIFGEMALIDDSPRSASAVAASDVRLAAVNRREFEWFVQQVPFFALQVMSVMVARLRRQMEAAG